MIHLSDATDFSFIYLVNNNDTYLLIFFDLSILKRDPSVAYILLAA